VAEAPYAPSSLIDSRDLIVFAYVTPDGYAHLGGTTQDWRYVARFFREMAEEAERTASASADERAVGT
jgi:hypothetical protein